MACSETALLLLLPQYVIVFGLRFKRYTLYFVPTSKRLKAIACPSTRARTWWLHNMTALQETKSQFKSHTESTNLKT
jgi:hypothetical protein